ncbi:MULTISPECIES: hypothetical protein [unclassified Nonomuraea]|uniref:hypothetical protein n=1 Tax=unclassified Nonomuraea TaxID=2593643 RepID=UPI0034054F65
MTLHVVALLFQAVTAGILLSSPSGRALHILFRSGYCCSAAASRSPSESWRGQEPREAEAAALLSPARLKSR